MSKFNKDAVQGLIDYVQEIKPYHTKLLDVLVEYTHTEPVRVSIAENFQIGITIDFVEFIYPSLTETPLSPSSGVVYKDKNTGIYYSWNGSSWVPIADPDHTFVGMELKEQFAFIVDVLELRDDITVQMIEPIDPGYETDGGFGVEWDANDSPLIDIAE